MYLQALPRQQEDSMSRYVVRFMKDVLGENGREIEVCQSLLEVDASDAGEATEVAKRKFCESQALCDWSLHADRIQIQAADYPS
jgi:hypothetical protein